MDWNWFRKNSSLEIADENRPQKLTELTEHLNDKYGDFEYAKDARALDAEKVYEATMTNVVKKMLLGNRDTKLPLLIAGANSGVEVDLFNDFQITAIDLSDVAIRKISKQYPEVRVVYGDIQNLPFTNKSFDAYVCLRAIHASNLNIQKALEESLRVTRSYLVYSVSNGYNIEGKLVKGMYNNRSKEIEEHLSHKHLATIKEFLIQHDCEYEVFEVPSEIIVFAKL
jgi:SAM-dependent methyltransferase